jgi:NADPH-dependent 2,4-dienoyl-CoA reductase/sulfur reductase-like enzyme
LGTAALGLNLIARSVCLSDGTSVAYDRLIIATGANARNLPGAEKFSNLHTLRSLDDALALREAFDHRPRVLIVGAGFIGSEVAASARSLGLDVSLVEMLELPLLNAVGREIGEACARLHEDHGVDLRLGVGVESLQGADRVERVILSDGTSITTDVVVVGIGVTPATGWLERSGLTLRDGVVCDRTCQAAPGVYAAGDVARWYNPAFDEEMRVEHWTNAVEQGMAVAENLLLGPMAAKPFATVPYFWSDQYTVKINFIGRYRPGDELQVVEGSIRDRRFLGLYRRGDRLIGGISFGRPRSLLAFQDALARRTTWEDALRQVGNS